MRHVIKHALAATAAVAPLLGALLTVCRIVGSFKGTSGSRVHIMAALAHDLSQSLIPFAYGLAIGIIAKLAHGDPTARQQHSGYGIDIAARELANALTRHRCKAPFLDRGLLDTLPVVANAAFLLAGLLLLNAATRSSIYPWDLISLVAAALLAILNRRAFHFLDSQHQTLEAEMETWNAIP